MIPGVAPAHRGPAAERLAPLCGNTVHQDRRFMVKYLPVFEAYFHYRNLDVSTLKELARRWRPELLAGFRKAEHVEVYTAAKMLLPVVGIVAGTFLRKRLRNRPPATIDRTTCSQTPIPADPAPNLFPGPGQETRAASTSAF